MLNFQELTTKKVSGEIPEGKYTARLVRKPENGKDPSKGYTGTDAHPDDIPADADYARFTYELEVNGKKRIITDIKNQKGIDIMTSHVRRQYGMQEQEVTLDELMDKMLEEVTIYISRPVVQTANGLRKVNNVDFVPPLAAPANKNAASDTPVVNTPNNVDTDGDQLPF